MTLDAGSVLLAGTLATVGGSAILAWLPTGRGLRDLPHALGSRVAADAHTAFVASVLVQVAFGIVGAFVYVWLWHVNAVALGPATGAASGAVHWVLSELAIGAIAARSGRHERRAFRPDRESLPLLASCLVYGTLLGIAYSPGS